MRLLVIVAVSVLLTAGSADSLAQRRIETGFLDRQIELNGQTYRYQVYVPSEYRADQPGPIVMDLHGDGLQGTDGLRHTAVGLANYIRQDRSRFPIIGVFPQARPNGGWPQREMQDLAIAQLDQTMREFKVDPSRQYLTGFSMGAMGVYRFAHRWADRFAAIVAIAGNVQSLPATSPPIRLNALKQIGS